MKWQPIETAPTDGTDNAMAFPCDRGPAGCGAAVRAGEGGAIAITYHDGTRYRIAVAYVGEGGIEPHVDYRVTDSGEFIKALG